MSGSAKTDKAARRDARLAEALRKNLRRRKDQARRRKTEQAPATDKPTDKP